MTLPTLQVQMDLNDPTSAATWGLDLTPYVRSGNITRGSQRELQRVEAGTGTLTLDNTPGWFTPNNTGSIYYPNLLPMRRIRIQGIFNSVTYPVIWGFVESWPAVFPQTGDDQVITVSLVDGFKVLSLAVLNTSFSAQLSGARVTAVLDAIGWPAGDRTIATGQSTVPAVTLANMSALEHLQAVEHAEGGRLFMSRDGKVTFLDRTISVAPSFTGRTWTDSGVPMSYRDITLAFTDELLINEARLTRDGGTEQVASNSASQTKYYRRSLVESGIQLSTDNEVLDLGGELVGKYAEPVLRIEGLVDNAMRHGQWNNVLVRELRDRILIQKTPRGSAAISQDSYIEGISHSWSEGTWNVSFNVSPAGGELPFIWDTSRWDVDTRWAR